MWPAQPQGTAGAGARECLGRPPPTCHTCLPRAGAGRARRSSRRRLWRLADLGAVVWWGSPSGVDFWWLTPGTWLRQWRALYSGLGAGGPQHPTRLIVTMTSTAKVEHRAISGGIGWINLVKSFGDPFDGSHPYDAVRWLTIPGNPSRSPMAIFFSRDCWQCCSVLHHHSNRQLARGTIAAKSLRQIPKER